MTSADSLLAQFALAIRPCPIFMDGRIPYIIYKRRSYAFANYGILLPTSTS